MVGAGLGGLTAAGFLQRAGFTVKVYEQAPQMGEVGAGIGLRPATMARFRQWGIFDAIANVSSASDYFEILTAAGEPIIAKLTRAPGNNAAIGGLKVVARNGWFAARPSGTEAVYKIYAESFKDEAHLQAILADAQQIPGEV